MNRKPCILIVILAVTASLVPGLIPDVSAAEQNVFTTFRDALVHVGQINEAGKPRLDKWLGTGFFVDDRCTIATAKHLFNETNKERIIIRFVDPRNRQKAWTRRAKIVHENPHKDLAFLRVLVASGKPCELGPMRTLPLHPHVQDFSVLSGEAVFMAGFPKLGYRDLDLPIARRGIIASAEIKDAEGVPLLLLDLTGAPGFSGSPVVLERTGEAIGIVFGPGQMKRSQDFEFATVITRKDYEMAVEDGID
jgi:S1-C subfamily serine protease